MVSVFRGFFRFIFFRLVPLLLIAAIGWSGYQVAQAVVRQFDERESIEYRSGTFAGTATSLAVVQVAQTVPTETPAPNLTDTLHPPSATTTRVPSETPTETLLPSPTPTQPEPTATRKPSSTPVPPSATPTETDAPTDTSVPATDIPEASFTPLVVAQFNATNTPRPVLFATNTAVGDAEVTIPPATVELTVTEEATGVPATSSDTPEPTAIQLPPTNTVQPSSTPEPRTATQEPAVPEATRPLPTVLFPQEGEAGRIINGTAVPTSVPLVPREHDLVNIILLGGDDELSEGGYYRTDTMIVVSINRDTNTVSMLSLPRDLFVYIPTSSGLMERLNVVFAYGDSIGWTDGGFGLLRQTILYNFGINVHYYARVDFTGFKEIIDTLGGVDIAVDCAYQDYGLIGAEVPEGAVEADDEGLRTLNVGYYTMNGAEALWYARTRNNSWDFDRGRRQQQLLRAIWRASLDKVNLTNAAQLWNQGMEMIETDMQLDDFLGLLPIALSLDVSRIRSFTMARDYHTYPWQPPDGQNVQLPIYDTMSRLMEDFYRPPANNQLLVEGATVVVYNGTANQAWDFVAADRLQWEGFRATSMGAADHTDYADTVLIDYTGQQKGSSLLEIARILNVKSENIRVEPDSNRIADFGVFVGANYNSCPGGVLPVVGAS